MNSLFIIIKKELKELFRDKKSLTMMLIIPFLIPVILIGMSALFNMEVNKDVSRYNKVGFSYELSEDEISIAKDVNIDYKIETDKDKLKKMYDDGTLNLYVTKEDNVYILNGNTSDNTTLALSLANEYFTRYKELLQKNYLLGENVDATKVIDIVSIKENILDKDNFFQNYIFTYGFLFIIMAITVSSTYPATDTTAGEKERGTLETLITFPVKSRDIILGKFLCVFISNLITGVLSLVFYYGSLVFAGNKFPIYKGIDLMLPLGTFLYILLVVVLFSLLIAGLSIAIASKCKTFKEAQSALTPLTFLSFFPGMIAFMVSISSSAVLSLVPCLNFVLLFQDLLAGNLLISNLLIMIASTIAFISVVLYVIIKQYKLEKIIL